MVEQTHWKYMTNALGVDNYQNMMSVFYGEVPPSRPDLTKRQIEWCRAHIPMFAEMQRLRGL